MKIGILSFPGSPSHGAALQMFALYSYLQKQGHDVEVINYISNKVNYAPSSKKKKRNIRAFLTGTFAKIFLKDNTPFFREFEAKINKYPVFPIAKTEDLTEVAQRYDRIVVGSDQVWNPVVTGDDMNYYLTFLEDSSKKATYAPSFGFSKISKDSKEEIAKALSEFRYLCVREKQGAKIIYDLIGKDVPVVLDPTFLLRTSIWEKQAKEIHACPRKYVLYYTIKPSEKLKKFAEELAKKTNCKLVLIGGRVREYFQLSKKPISGVGPSEFLWLIKNAQYVVTNSFHGTAFSVIFKKNFYVEYSSDTNSRLENLVETLGLKNSIVDENALLKPVVAIDYNKVSQALDKEKNHSVNYLQGVIKE